MKMENMAETIYIHHGSDRFDSYHLSLRKMVTGCRNRRKVQVCGRSEDYFGWVEWCRDKPNAGNEELLIATEGYLELLLPDIIIKCVGLVLALAVYPPIMMYSVLIAAAYIITLKAVIDRKAKRKLEEICLWTKKEYVVELKA